MITIADAGVTRLSDLPLSRKAVLPKRRSDVTRLLAGLLLIGVVGCGGSPPPQSVRTVPTWPSPLSVAEPTRTVVTPRANVAESPVKAIDADPTVAALDELGAEDNVLVFLVRKALFLKAAKLPEQIGSYLRCHVC